MPDSPGLFHKTPVEIQLEGEIERLRARVAELEAELMRLWGWFDDASQCKPTTYAQEVVGKYVVVWGKVGNDWQRR